MTKILMIEFMIQNLNESSDSKNMTIRKIDFNFPETDTKGILRSLK